MIFVDSGALLARYLPSDQYHTRSLELWRKLGESAELCVTSNFVLNETFTLLARRGTYQYAVRKARFLYETKPFNILRPTEDDERAALDLFEKFADQRVSFTDCVSFALMRRAGLDTVFSFDEHFVRAGFKLWA